MDYGGMQMCILLLLLLLELSAGIQVLQMVRNAVCLINVMSQCCAETSVAEFL